MAETMVTYSICGICGIICQTIQVFPPCYSTFVVLWMGGCVYPHSVTLYTSSIELPAQVPVSTAVTVYLYRKYSQYQSFQGFQQRREQCTYSGGAQLNLPLGTSLLLV